MKYSKIFSALFLMTTCSFSAENDSFIDFSAENNENILVAAPHTNTQNILQQETDSAHILEVSEKYSISSADIDSFFQSAERSLLLSSQALASGLQTAGSISRLIVKVELMRNTNILQLPFAIPLFYNTAHEFYSNSKETITLSIRAGKEIITTAQEGGKIIYCLRSDLKKFYDFAAEVTRNTALLFNNVFNNIKIFPLKLSFLIKDDAK